MNITLCVIDNMISVVCIIYANAQARRRRRSRSDGLGCNAHDARGDLNILILVSSDSRRYTNIIKKSVSGEKICIYAYREASKYNRRTYLRTFRKRFMYRDEYTTTIITVITISHAPKQLTGTPSVRTTKLTYVGRYLNVYCKECEE